jgi:hypothetical protein
LQSEPWRASDGKFDKNKLAAAIGTAAGKELGAAFEEATWDSRTGEVTVTLRRPNQAIPELKVVDMVEITMLIAPEKPSVELFGEGIIVWLGNSRIAIVDEGPEPRLKFATVLPNRRSVPVDMDALVVALARDLQGRVWNSEQSNWK